MGAGLSANNLPICVDFDGTLIIPTEPWNGDYSRIIGYPPPFTFQRLHEYAAWRPLVILSARAGDSRGWWAITEWIRTEDQKWCADHEVEEELRFTVTDKKPPAYCYLDDKGIRFIGVFPTVEELEGMESWYLK